LLTYAGAGHYPGFVLNGAGQVKATLESEGLPLGLEMDAEFPSSPCVDLLSGDLLFLFTDGLIDARQSGETVVFGMQRAVAYIQSHCQNAPHEILESLHSIVCTFSEPEGLFDDATAVIVRAAFDSELSRRDLDEWPHDLAGEA
jgi:serine phosphatase RsbU (regulator of sigma subunit)